MFKYSRFTIISFFLFSSMGLNIQDAGARALQLVDHSAIYSFEAGKIAPGTDLADIGGHMDFRWEGDCQGWSVTQNYKIDYKFHTGPPSAYKSRTISYEAKDGSLYRFMVEKFNNGAPGDVIKGQVERQADGAYHFSYKTPQDFAIKPYDNVLFPSAHTHELFKRAEAGERFFSHPFFDGSDLSPPMFVTNFILGSAKADQASLADDNDEIDETLLDAKAYKARLSFFDGAQQGLKNDAQSLYEMDIVIHENGVVSEMVIDYDDFALTAKLKSLKALEADADQVETECP